LPYLRLHALGGGTRNPRKTAIEISPSFLISLQRQIFLFVLEIAVVIF
jgi:hypothetical protein